MSTEFNREERLAEVLRNQLPSDHPYSIACREGFRRESPIFQALAEVYWTPSEEYKTGRKSILEEEKEDTFATALPLPVTHSDFIEEQESISAKASGRRVGETVDQLILGRTSIDEYDTLKLYGLTTHPRRITLLRNYSRTLVEDTEKAIKLLRDKQYYGPYLRIISTKEDQCWSVDNGQVVPSTWLAKDEAIVVQLTADNIRMVNTVLPFVTKHKEGYKFLCCIVPQIRKNLEGNIGIVHIFP